MMGLSDLMPRDCMGSIAGNGLMQQRQTLQCGMLVGDLFVCSSVRGRTAGLMIWDPSNQLWWRPTVSLASQGRAISVRGQACRAICLRSCVEERCRSDNREQHALNTAAYLSTCTGAKTLTVSRTRASAENRLVAISTVR